MDIATAFWMVIFVGVILGPFLYFANLAFSNEKGKK